MRFPSLVVHHDIQPGRDPLLDNDDIRPVSKARRTWSFWTWNFFWLSAVATAATFYLASAFVVAGLTPWEGIGCYIIGNSMIAVLMCFTGRPGAVYGFPFPVQCRVAFGVWGAAVPAVIRAILSCVWHGVSTISAVKAIYVMLHAVFPSIAKIPDHMGPKSALTSAQMICLVVFLFCTAAILSLDVHKWNRLVYAKAIVFALSTMSLLIFVITKAGGVGATVSKGSHLPIGEKVWLCLEFIAIAAATSAFFASNASDWQRNSVSANAPILGQLIGFPFAYFVVPLIGMLTASSSQLVYGDVIWDPFTYVDMLLTDNYTPANRAGVFFIGAGLAFSGMVSTIMENCITSANDWAAVLPKYISIKRGYFVTIAISLIINPWYLMGSAGIFLNVINAFNIFLLSNCGILVADYFFVVKGQVDADCLYDRRPDGPYYFWRGLNWRAFLAYTVAIAMNFPGYLQSIGVLHYGQGLARSYYFAPYTSTFVAGILYWVLCRYFDSPSYRSGKFKEPKVYVGFEPEEYGSEAALADGLEEKDPLDNVRVLPVVE